MDKIKTCDKCGEALPAGVNVCPACKENQTPYYRKKLPGDKETARDQFTIEVNSEERAQIEALKELWDFKSDSKVLKLCLENAINSHNVAWSASTWRYVLSVNRQRLSNFKKLPELPLKENARQI